MQTVKLNVSGRKYQVSMDTLSKIPYLFNMLNGCDCEDVPSETIFIPRSPLVFDHVLAFVIDEKHPFPSEYFYELDFFDIKYDKTKLYNPYNRKLDRIDNIVLNMYSDYKQKDYGCNPPFCETIVPRNKFKCEKCIHVTCFIKNCQTLTSSQYCDIHRVKGSYCDIKNCSNRRMKDEIFCFDHTKI